MPSQITTKNSSTGAAVPVTGDLVQGELAVNVADKKLYTKDAGGSIVELGINPTTIDINAGTIDGTTIGATTPSTGVFTNVTGTLLTAAQPNITSLGTITSLVATTADINGGTIDGTVIGGATPAAISGTTGTFSGEITANGGIALGDNDKATFGASDDLQLYHDGTASIIKDVGTGHLIIGGTNLYLKNAELDETYIDCVDDGSVYLRNNNSVKLTTTSTGIDVTGTATMDGFVVDGSASAFGSTASNAYIMKTDGTGSSPFNAAGSLVYQPRSTDSNGYGDHLFYTGSTQKLRQKIDATGDISFYEDTGTTAKFFWDASAEKLNLSGTGGLDVTGDIDVDGTATMDGLTVGGTFAFADNVNGVVNTANSLLLNIDSDNGGTAEHFTVATNRTGTTGGTELFKVLENGNVGIGTSSPNTPLQVSGANSSTNADALFSIQKTTEGYGLFGGVLSSGTSWLQGGTSNDATDYSIVLQPNGGNVGIGTDSPDVIASSVSSLSLGGTNAGTSGGISYQVNGTTKAYHYVSSGFMLHQASAGVGHRFLANNAERMRIDSSGNVLVGKTSSVFGTAGTQLYANGEVNITKTGTPLHLNRLSTDGTIASFYKDGTAVGGIGANGGNLYIVSNDVGLNFAGGGDGIYPATTNGAQRDAAIDLGHSTHRFKDLYLSGGVYLGGTGAANKLDDYEEGTWTPAITGSGGTSGTAYTTQVGGYTKVGNKVTANFHVKFSNEGTLTGTTRISGLPFIGTTTPQYCVAATTAGSMNIDADQQVVAIQYAANAILYLFLQEPQLALAQISGNTSFTNTSEIAGSVSYFTNS